MINNDSSIERDKMISFTFARRPRAGVHTPLYLYDPELVCDINGNEIHLKIFGRDDYGLLEALEAELSITGMTLPDKGQATYEQLKSIYKDQVGKLAADVTLQRKPILRVEGGDNADWHVLKLGGAECFEGLEKRLRSAGCEAESCIGRDNIAAVRFWPPGVNELDELIRLAPVIMNRS